MTEIQRGLLEKAERVCKEGGKLIEKIRALKRIEHMDLKRVSVLDVIEGIKHKHEAKLEEGGVSLVFTADDPKVMIIRKRFSNEVLYFSKLILQNLIFSLHFEVIFQISHSFDYDLGRIAIAERTYTRGRPHGDDVAGFESDEFCNLRYNF